jgi:hypothetical protein
MTDGRNHFAGGVHARWKSWSDGNGADVHGIERRRLTDAILRLKCDNRLLHQAYDSLAREHAMAWVNYSTLHPLRQRLIRWIAGRNVIGLVEKD